MIIAARCLRLTSQGTWFQKRGLWKGNSYELRPGDIILPDWDNAGQDGSSDHAGIVVKIEKPNRKKRLGT